MTGWNYGMFTIDNRVDHLFLIYLLVAASKGMWPVNFFQQNLTILTWNAG